MGRQRRSSQDMPSNPQQLAQTLYTGQMLLYSGVQLIQHLHQQTGEAQGMVAETFAAHESMLMTCLPRCTY